MYPKERKEEGKENENEKDRRRRRERRRGSPPDLVSAPHEVTAVCFAAWGSLGWGSRGRGGVLLRLVLAQ